MRSVTSAEVSWRTVGDLIVRSMTDSELENWEWSSRVEILFADLLISSGVMLVLHEYDCFCTEEQSQVRKTLALIHGFTTGTLALVNSHTWVFCGMVLYGLSDSVCLILYLNCSTYY